MKTVLPVTAVYYPETDGKPMGETDEHRDEMVRHIGLLRHHFQGQRVYVSGNLLVYYEQGNPKRFVVPDLFVVKGVSPRKRRIYKIWVERKVPNLIIETTSRKTRRVDTDTKPKLYARLGVQEYFLFDPDHEYLDPPLQGYRLVGKEYQQLQPAADGSLISEQLNMRLIEESGEVEFYRLDTGERLLTADERAAREAERAAIEQGARRKLEAEVARLREALARRGPPPST